MQYGIWARVSGGVTGTREAWVKGDGVVIVFDTLEEAAAAAYEYMERTQGSPFRTCDFSYVAREFKN